MENVNEILTTVKPIRDNLLIECVYEISNLLLHNIKDLQKPGVSELISTKIVAIGDKVDSELLNTSPIFSSKLGTLVDNGAATPIIDSYNSQSIRYFIDNNLFASIGPENKHSKTKFIEYVLINVNYLIGIK